MLLLIGRLADGAHGRTTKKAGCRTLFEAISESGMPVSIKRPVNELGSIWRVSKLAKT